ncbi:MAG: hypothetical protein IPH64_20035 [Comamonadaceae bacterium]|nr:hypothetical protein [Comamonadaceae bacterium]
MGKPIDQAVLDNDMRRIYGTGDFEHVNYTLIDEPGRRVLAVEAVEKTWGPDYARFGMGLSSDFTGQSSFFTLAASYRKTWLNALGASWRNMVQFGFNNMVASEFYQPLNAEGDYFVAPNISYSNPPCVPLPGPEQHRQLLHQLGPGRPGRWRPVQALWRAAVGIGQRRPAATAGDRVSVPGG